ncbi:MAG: DUF6623 family protein [Bacteroidota bacterium]
MAITQAMWIHGNSIKVEYHDRIKSIWRAGFYARIVGKPGTTNWFHFSIPTTVIVNDKRQMIDSVMLRFKSGSNKARVTNIDIYDGEWLIASHSSLGLYPAAFGLERFNVPGKPEICWGVGISIGVSFTGTTDAQNTIEFSAAGCDFNLFESVRLHFKVLTTPTVSIDQMLASMREVYEPVGFRVVRMSDETLNLPALNTVDVGECRRGSTTAEQNTLFGNRNNVGANDVVVYFVEATNPPYNGCAAHPDGRPGAVVASGATRWTMGHEVGHVLGLSHVDNNDRLMTGNGTGNITNPPPDLISSEITTMRNSTLTVNP